MFRELYRKDKQISHEECIALLKKETRGVLSVLGDDGYPYGMPMNHFYDEKEGKIYFHCGNMKSHRTDALKQNPKVSFCVYEKGVQKENDWVYQVRSVIVFGKAEIVSDPKLTAEIATELCRKFTSDEEYIKREIELYAHETLILVLTPEHICGKTVTES